VSEALAPSPGLSLGIDIGGTFTDLVLHDPLGARSGSLKVLTTHADPVEGILEGTRRLLSQCGVAPAALGRVVHATTLFTNALIERKGARTALLTTAGFRDVLVIGRERRYELYDLQLRPPAPLVEEAMRLEVPERVKADGTVLVPLDLAALEARAREAVEARRGVPRHPVPAQRSPSGARGGGGGAPRRLLPGLPVTASHAIVREVREYDRGSTAVANAYVAPLAERYLARLAAELTALGLGAPLLLMLSNGGLTHVREARRAPVQLLESGPAAGALAAAFLAGPAEGRLLAFDLGGTTAKLCVVEGGEPEVVFGFEAARQARFIEGSGLPIRISTVDLIEIGAGGGSIARRDAIGLLKVGPDSAGSEPGPACYGRGGTAPTVTDANLLLGFLDPASFAGGSLPLDRDAAARAVGALAEALGLSPEATAWGITTWRPRPWRAPPGRIWRSGAATPPISRSSAPAAAGRCTDTTWRASSASAASSFRPRPGSLPPSACWPRRPGWTAWRASAAGWTPAPPRALPKPSGHWSGRRRQSSQAAAGSGTCRPPHGWWTPAAWGRARTCRCRCRRPPGRTETGQCAA
jgi:N-methylhydantoinase A